MIIDLSHKYTVVEALPYIGPGGAHHHYSIIRKSDSEQIGLVDFQDGPIKESGVNGIMNENLIAIVIDRLRGFQSGKYACRPNAIALTKLEEALMWLKERTRDREERMVEGTHAV